MIFTPSSIVLVAVACILAVAYGIWAEAQVAPHHERHLMELERQALDQAYIQQVIHLFGQWMKDPTEQPERATRGVRQAREAYSGALLSIEEREQAK